MKRATSIRRERRRSNELTGNTGTKDGNVPLLPPRYFHAVGEFRVKPEEQREVGSIFPWPGVSENCRV